MKLATLKRDLRKVKLYVEKQGHEMSSSDDTDYVRKLQIIRSKNIEFAAHQVQKFGSSIDEVCSECGHSHGLDSNGITPQCSHRKPVDCSDTSRKFVFTEEKKEPNNFSALPEIRFDDSRDLVEKPVTRKRKNKFKMNQTVSAMPARDALTSSSAPSLDSYK